MSGTIFGPKAFMEAGFDKTAAETAAKVANEVARKGNAVVGRVLSDGTIKDFGTALEPTDTHVGILVGLSPMAYFEREAAPVRQEQLQADDINRETQRQLALMKIELEQLRPK